VSALVNRLVVDLAPFPMKNTPGLAPVVKYFLTFWEPNLPVVLLNRPSFLIPPPEWSFDLGTFYNICHDYTIEVGMPAIVKKFTPEQIALLKRDGATDEDIRELEASLDPVTWSESYLTDPDVGKTKFECRDQFKALLRDGSLNRAARVGRQQGKTVHMCVDILHCAGINQHAVILIFVPEKKNMNRMLEIMQNLIRGSELRTSYRLGTRKKLRDALEPEYDYEIKASTGSVIRFFFMKQRPDKARGQTATHIYVDEAEYLPDKAWPVINGIIKGNPNIPIWASSTPSGLEDTWFRQFCDKCADPKNKNGAEYHLPSTLEKNWPQIEARLRELIFDEVTWKLEVLAEWAEAKGAVYKGSAIDEALMRGALAGRYLTMEELRQTLEYERGSKYLGVDWNNPQNGVRIIEICTMFGRPWVTRHESISYAEYTQSRSVERIVNLYKEGKHLVISVDSGYGETQIELLQKELPKVGGEPSKLLNIVDSTKKEKMVVEYDSPETGGRRRNTIVVRVKTKIVGLLAKYLEESLVLPKEEEGKRDGLIKELRNFRRKGYQRDGGFEYTDNTHSLSALQFCVHGYDIFSNSLQMRPQSAHLNIQTAELYDVVRESRSVQAAQNVARIATGSLGPIRGGQSRSRTAGLYGGTRRTLL